MKADLLLRRRIVFGAGRYADLLVWRVPRPVPGSRHVYKYRFAYVVEGVCVLRYDNEAGKGDHRHLGALESPYVFTTPEQLVEDFLDAIGRWNDEHGHF
ncbi:MAG: hypothetical protein KGZ52_04550 [Xanthomonadaceae bacterium]|nr:hypothetical protein [Xanthomonadaceae bacterium]